MTEQTRGKKPSRTRRARNRTLGIVLALAQVPGLGCGREFFREWANQDVSEAIFEKSRDPRWRLDMFSTAPPALSRFANPYDPDRPPAPPDDYASEALSPVPQWPDIRLLTPVEGTGYIDMLEAWQRAQPAPAAAAAARATTPDPAGNGAAPPPPPVPASSTPPFGPPENSEPSAAPLSPIPEGGPAPAGPAVPAPNPGSGAQADRNRQDPGVLLAAFQATNIPPPATPPGASVSPSPGPTLPTPAVNLDPRPTNRDLTEPVNPRPDLGGEERAIEGETAELSGILVPGAMAFDEAEAAGLPRDSHPYVVTPEQAFRLSLINNRWYQFHLENIYLASLAVTLQRFAFEPQFIAGLSPTTGSSAGSLSPNPGNSFLYRTNAAPGGQVSALNLGTVAGFGKVFSNGARVLGGFANTMVFNFVGSHPRQPLVQSVLPLSVVIPFLRGGGRAVTLEALTLAERNLLYEVRNFARFRQEYMVSIMTDTVPVSVAGTNEPVVGYLNLLQQLQTVENDRRNVAAFERYLEVFGELAKGIGSGLSQLQVDQIDQSLQSARLTLVSDLTQYRILLDQFKIQIGLPPDVPMIPDRRMTAGFRDVFDRIDRWTIRRNRKLEDLAPIVADLPALQEVVIDGRPVVAMAEKPDQLEDLNLAAERLALENRVDLMNARAQLYDSWRQLAVTTNALKGVFNVAVTNQIFTPSSTTNPLAFVDQAKQFSVVLNAELPLVRVNERNNYMTAQINYERQRRSLMLQEDSIKFAVRQEIRNMQFQAQSYAILKRRLVLTLRTRDQTFEQLVAPVAGDAGGAGGQGAIQTTNLVSFQTQILQSQTGLITTWVNYETLRLSLYRDLGIMPYDEWEAFDELFPANPRATKPAGAGGPDRPDARPPATATTGPTAGRVRT